MNANLNPLRLALLGLLPLLPLATGSLRATPYASGITNQAGNVSFFLNEPADEVKVIFDGGGPGNTNNLGPLSRGAFAFALGGHASWQIHVTKSSAQVWSPVSDDANPQVQFFAPTSLDVNKNPASPYFGRIYVLEHAGAGGTGTTGTGRTVTKGIFALNADLSDAIGQGDSGFTGGLEAFGLFGAAANRWDPFKIAVGEDDFLYVADAQDPRGALGRMDGNLSNGELVLAGVGNATQTDVHTVIYGIHIRGSLGAGNLTVWGTDGQWQNFAACNSVLRWNINAGPLASASPPTVLAQPGYPTTELDSDLDVAPDGNIFVLLFRSAVDVGAVKVYSPTGTLLWNSLIGGQDVFLNAVNLKVSPDATKLAIIRNDQRTWIVGLTNGPNGRLPDLSNTNLINTFAGTSTSSSRGRTVNWDAAGNLYVANRSAELLRIWSPGGTKTAITGSDGTFQLVSPPTIVSVSTGLASANEAGPVNGVFTITRSGDTSGPLPVSYTVGGTAASGADYAALSGSVTFLGGQAATNIPVAVADDAEAEFTETVVLTLNGNPAFGIGTGTATVSIFDNETPELSFATAATNRLLESYAPLRATHQFTRRGRLADAVTVQLSYGGSAGRGADFDGPLTVPLAADTTTASITLSPMNDQAYEGEELGSVTLAPGAGYTVGAANAAYTTIVDDEAPVGTVLFSDNFNADSASGWQVNVADPTDGFVEFAWDYGTLAGIPPAPATTDGSTKGVRMRCGNVVPQASGLSLSPLGGNFTGDYRLKFDVWINYNGPLPDGGPGSTQHFDAGVGTAGDQAVWYNSSFADGVWFTCSGDGADGVNFGDYSAYIGAALQNDDTGFYGAGTGAPNSGLRDHANAYYANIWGGQTAPAAQLALFPGQTGVANRGNAGMAWHSVVITKRADTVTWQMDGILLATVTNDPVNLSTNVFIGYQDRFSGSLSDVPEMSFGLVDNLRVESFVNAPVLITITGIRIVGGNVEITFTGPATTPAGNFKVVSSGNVAGGYLDDHSAVLSELGGGNFKAVLPVGAGPQFYRIKL